MKQVASHFFFFLSLVNQAPRVDAKVEIVLFVPEVTLTVPAVCRARVRATTHQRCEVGGRPESESASRGRRLGYG